MKRFLTILLCTTMLFAMAACQSSAPATSQPIETTEETKSVDTYPYPAINDKLTRQNLEALPGCVRYCKKREKDREHSLSFSVESSVF